MREADIVLGGGLGGQETHVILTLKPEVVPCPWGGDGGKGGD